MGWNEISFTGYINDCSLALGWLPRRWHLKEKLSLEEVIITTTRLAKTQLTKHPCLQRNLWSIYYSDNHFPMLYSLNSHSSLHTADSKATFVVGSETGHNTCLPLQRRYEGLQKAHTQNRPRMAESNEKHKPTLYGVLGLFKLYICMCRPAVPTTKRGYFTSNE